jgi:2-polyprenyl-3-methyl-5-hydroxy-6-metoxy-1,4-benzoquinol methylase
VGTGSNHAKGSGVVVASEGHPTGHFLQPHWGSKPQCLGTLRDRFDVVWPLITGDSVLDVGCASSNNGTLDDWMHGYLSQKVPDLVGIDSDESIVTHLQAEGFDIHLADAQDFDLGRTFDTVFAGEIIEHLDDVHGFLASIRRHLAPTGRLVLTTPNVFYVAQFVYRWGGHSLIHHEHTCWYCEDTLRRVLEINGFSRVEISFTSHTSTTPVRKTATYLAQHLLPPRLALDTLIAVASVE